MDLASNLDLCPVLNFQDWLGRPEVGKEATATFFFRPGTLQLGQSCQLPTGKNLAAAMEGSNLPSITPHCFRVGGASAMIEGSASIDEVVQLAGTWAAPRSTQVYMKRSISRRVEAAKKGAALSHGCQFPPHAGKMGRSSWPSSQ